jgi:predicted Rossmann-fold nucleotide-binding protein
MMRTTTLKKVVSGGQTGVDRAALDAALNAGMPIGGYCPAGRLAEDGRVPDRYPLVEMPEGGYAERTEQNVIESDGTLILNMGTLSQGTLLTAECAEKHGRPCLILQLDHIPTTARAVEWLKRHDIRILNVAGPRESKYPGIYKLAFRYLSDLFRIADINGIPRKPTDTGGKHTRQ